MTKRVYIFVFLLLLFNIKLQASEPPPAGTIINNTNVDQYSDYVDQPLLELIKNNAVTIEVIPTYSIAPNKLFEEQTLANQGKAKLDPATGHIQNYHGGMPFTEDFTTEDSSAGLKLAWNMRYAYGGDGSLVTPFIWDYKNMRTAKVERTLSFIGKTLRFKYRSVMEPLPELPKNTANIFAGIYLLAKKPFDLLNTQLLIHRPEDDDARDSTWLYLATQRRVRRLPSGQTTDAFLGSDFMIEDFLGYNGRIKDMTWTYLGTKQMLQPFFNYDEIPVEKNAVNPDGFKFGLFHGQGDCFPDVPWQMRKVHILEAVPTWKEHPLSKRIFYVDAETHIPVAGRYYDRSKKIWRVAIAAFSHPDHHLEHNKDSGVAIPTLITMIDVQAKHCTTLKMRTLVNDPSVKQKDFTVQSLRSRGR